MKSASIKTRINLGIFALCVGIVAALCVIVAADDLSFFRRSRVFTAYFENTAGLVVGAPVRMGGVEVGRIIKIVIEPRPNGMAIAATLRINSPFFELMRRDASVALDTQGLLGDKFVALHFGTGITPLAEGDLIRTRDVEGLAKAVEKSVDIMDTVSATAKKVDTFTSGLPDVSAMKAVGNDIATSTKILRNLMLQLTAKDSFLSMLDDRESKILLKKTLLNIESTAAHVDAITQKIDSGQGTLGALINDRTLYEDIRSILGHIDRGKIARRVFIEAGSKEKPNHPP